MSEAYRNEAVINTQELRRIASQTHGLNADRLEACADLLDASAELGSSPWLVMRSVGKTLANIQRQQRSS